MIVCATTAPHLLTVAGYFLYNKYTLISECVYEVVL